MNLTLYFFEAVALAMPSKKSFVRTIKSIIF
jgi:hypothetical protein